MDNLKSLEPTAKPRVMDLVRKAGVDVGDWENITRGKEWAASNPKYCYEWSYIQPGKLIVLNLWYSALQEKKGIIYSEINYREMSERLAHKPSWHKRAGNADKYAVTAFKEHLPVRVIVCDGIQRNRNDPESSTSVVTKRMLDPVPWFVEKYNTKTGAVLLKRGDTSLLINMHNSASHEDIGSTRVLFARIGYMKYYKGSASDDQKPIGGGKYNDKNTGHEIYNYKDVSGKIYGYVQPYVKNRMISDAKINLKRISPNASGEFLKNVLVIFFASLPEDSGQVIVGWYKNATVYQDYQKSKKLHQREKYSYNIEADTQNCTLLPSDLRSYQIAGVGLTKTGRPGQANAFYAYEKGKPKPDRWIKEAIEYIDSYEGRNILRGVDSDIEVQQTSTLEAEKEYAKSTGQAFNSSAKARKAIEDYSMKKAKEYFTKKLGYKFERDTSRNHSYDLEFSKNGELLFLEVKGTQSDGRNVFLTRNETVHVNGNKHRCALYILHSIDLKETKKTCTCNGGSAFVINPWKIDQRDLQVVTYQYQVPKNE